MNRPLILARFDCAVVKIPLQVKVSHHLAQRVFAENVLVTAYDQHGQSGWGECCPREYVTGETIEGVQQVLASQYIPTYLRREFASFADVVQALSDSAAQMPRNQQAAFCALELAVLDLAGKHFDCSAADAIGGAVRDSFTYTGVLAADDIDGVTKQAARLRQFGFNTVKVKATRDLDFNTAALELVRHLFGNETSLRVDANGAWPADEAIRQLTALKEYNLQGVEQPVPGDDHDAMAKVTAAGITPVVADESLCSIADAEQLITARGCDIFNIRISKCGGLINSASIARTALNAGLRCQLGAQVGETGFLSAAGRHFASAFPDLVWLEGSFDAYLLDRQITAPDITITPGGKAGVLTRPGLGVTPLLESIKAATVSRQKF